MRGAADSEPKRVTVSLTQRTVDRVNKISAAHDDTRTDTINRAVALYAMLDEIQDDGGTLMVRRADGSIEELRLVR